MSLYMTEAVCMSLDMTGGRVHITGYDRGRVHVTGYDRGQGACHCI